MCSILGGTIFDERAQSVYEKAKNRGRDVSGLVQLGSMWIANHRGTPTNESEAANNQPFGTTFKVVHNGTIANDIELGGVEGEIDSKVLERVLDPTNTTTLRDSLTRIKGSYAIAVLTEREIFLACNYKPIWYVWVDCQHFFFSSLREHLEHLGEPIRVEPYTVMNMMSESDCDAPQDLPRTQPNRGLIICSGGLDSTAITGYVKQKHDNVHLLHFDYGCKAGNREKEAVKEIAEYLECDFDVIPIDYKTHIGNSTLFNDEKVATGKEGVEYALEWVPARNLVLLSLAVAFAEAHGFGYIYLGTNLEEAGAYPDNEEQFILDFNHLMYGAVQNGVKIEIKTPLGGLMKREIVQFGTMYNSPIHLSWSCYNGGEVHCGECAPCYMRKKAFERSNINDKTQYNEKQVHD